MGKIIGGLPEINGNDVAENDLFLVQDVSKPKTKVVLLSGLRNAILKVGAITNVMIEVGSITRDKLKALDFEYASADANGWRLSYDSRGKRVWRKRSATSFTWGANEWVHRNLSALPVGMTNLNNVWLEGSACCNDAAITVNLNPNSSSTNISAATQNKYAGTVTSQAVQFSVTLTEI